MKKKKKEVKEVVAFQVCHIPLSSKQASKQLKSRGKN